MIDTDMKYSVENHLKSSGVSQALDYDLWAKNKIKTALDAANAEPEKRIPQEKLWVKYGLEY